MSEKLLQALLVEMKAMRSDVADIKTDVAELKDDVSKLKSDVAGLKKDVKSLEGRVGTIEKNMAMKENVADIPKIKLAAIETLDVLNSLKRNEMKHERALEVLSLRSIEHEAELKRIEHQ